MLHLLKCYRGNRPRLLGLVALVEANPEFFGTPAAGETFLDLLDQKVRDLVRASAPKDEPGTYIFLLAGPMVIVTGSKPWRRPKTNGKTGQMGNW